MAWSLAERGVRVALVERATFPREKVCGDFVEPAGLRILAHMGCTELLAPEARLPITRNRVYFGPRLAYHGEIPYYQGGAGLPSHGYIIPREELDTALLGRAEAASTCVRQGCAAVGLSREDGVMRLAVREGDAGRVSTLTARLVIGADGTESVIARATGLARKDRRHISISQRVYVEGVSVQGGEAAVWFDEDLYPGYGWMFPMPGGRANVGVGILSESCDRFGLSVPRTLAESIERLSIRHPGCADIRVASRPIGGVVKMYGGVGRNHFDGGLLIGDAGSFVDPMTGEGITQGMESAMLGARTVLSALEAGRFDAAWLSAYEREFRAYFNPSMRYLELCAAIMRNRHFREFWLRSTLRGFERAQTDREFGRIAGAAFGGLDLQPGAAMGQIWTGVLAYGAESAARMVADLAAGRGPTGDGLMGDLAAWERGWRASVTDDPAWHWSWIADVVAAAARSLPSVALSAESPRVKGPLAVAS